MESKFKIGDTVYFMYKNKICCSKVKNVDYLPNGGAYKDGIYLYETELLENDYFEERLLFSFLDEIIGYLVRNIIKPITNSLVVKCLTCKHCLPPSRRNDDRMCNKNICSFEKV